jgi:hypothetical protein
MLLPPADSTSQLGSQRHLLWCFTCPSAEFWWVRLLELHLFASLIFYRVYRRFNELHRRAQQGQRFDELELIDKKQNKLSSENFPP